jgi:hypothetical protein
MTWSTLITHNSTNNTLAIIPDSSVLLKYLSLRNIKCTDLWSHISRFRCILDCSPFLLKNWIFDSDYVY